MKIFLNILQIIYKHRQGSRNKMLWANRTGIMFVTDLSPDRDGP